jgi:hypothetical protein
MRWSRVLTTTGFIAVLFGASDLQAIPIYTTEAPTGRQPTARSQDSHRAGNGMATTSDRTSSEVKQSLKKRKESMNGQRPRG